MIRAEFYESNGKLKGFSISGHAGYAESGYDIVCAAVSSAVELTCNLITESFGIEAEVTAKENKVSCKVSKPEEMTEKLIGMLKIHLGYISEEFPKTIKITNSEV